VQKAGLLGGSIFGPAMILANLTTPRLIARFGAKNVMTTVVLVMAAELVLFFFLTYWVNIYVFTTICSVLMGYVAGEGLTQ